MLTVRRALLSCWNKTGLERLAERLVELEVELISSGGTAAYLSNLKIPVTAVEDETGHPEVLSGRVKTLHPAIHAGILSDRSEAHRTDLQANGIQEIDLVVVNLYPFLQEAVQKELPIEKAIEFIDIGGPTLLRAAAKNYQHAVAVANPADYPALISELDEHGGRISEAFSLRQARRVFAYSSWYDGQVQRYFGIAEGETTLPAEKTLSLKKSHDLRYGENPHQQAAVYLPAETPVSGLAAMEQLWGKALSFNNYVDVQAAYAIALEFEKTAVAIIKHTNPCGAATLDATLKEVFEAALRGDPLSAFGGIVALNRPVDEETATEMSKIFFECIIAPAYDDKALDILKKKKNLRLLKLSPDQFFSQDVEVKSLSGGYLIQELDFAGSPETESRKVAGKMSPTPEEERELEFAWIIAKHVKSNAIVLTKDCELYGVGAGQMSRVDSVKIARMKAEDAGRELKGLTMASDAFFPFRDGLDEAAKSGVKAVIQPGGSVRDEEVIAAADDHDICMVFTATRHFKH